MHTMLRRTRRFASHAGVARTIALGMGYFGLAACNGAVGGQSFDGGSPEDSAARAADATPDAQNDATSSSSSPPPDAALAGDAVATPPRDATLDAIVVQSDAEGAATDAGGLDATLDAGSYDGASVDGEGAHADAEGPDADAEGPDADASGAVTMDAQAVDSGGSSSALCEGCGAGLKLCVAACVSNENILYGCAASTCTPCPSLPHAQVACGAQGTCSIGTCEPGWADCNGDPADGCEANLASPATCTGCAVACSGETPLCTSSGCAASCDGSDALCTDRCVNLESSADHCGSCGNACTATTGFPACSAGACTLSCPPGFTSCGSGATQYCADLQGDWQNCGSCGTICPAASRPGVYPGYEAFLSCSAGQCGQGCQGGWTVCGGVCVTTQTDSTNCGACGATCAPDAFCSQSACVPKSSLWLTTGLTRPREIVLDEARLYWLDPAAGTVSAMPKQGGPIALLAQNQVAPTVLAEDATFVYWGATVGGAPSVLRAPKDGSSPPSIVATGGSGFIGVDDAFIYSTAVAPVPVSFLKTSKSGGVATTITVTPNLDFPARMLGVDNAGLNMYVAPLIESFVRVDTTTGASTGLGGSSGPMDSVPLADDGGLVLFPAYVTNGSLCFGAGFDGTLIQKFPYVACSSEPGAPVSFLLTYLYPGANQFGGIPERDGPHPASIARNSCGAFWSTGSWLGGSLGAGTLEMGVPGSLYGAELGVQADPQYVAADDRFVYWTDGSGAIGKLPIP